MHGLPPGLDAALADYAARLRSRFGGRLRLVSLFGSWARGEAHQDSDLDVAVVIEDLTRAEWREAVGLAAFALVELGEPLSPFVVSGARFDELRARERRIAQDILTEGMAL